jgi:hypothetical protein
VIPFEREPKRDRGREPSRSFERRAQRDLTNDATPHADPGAASRRDLASRAGWLIGPLCLCAIAAAMLFVFRGPDEIFAIAFGLVLAIGLAWILISALFPASADRQCPRCGRASVVRADPNALTGLRCRACGWRDDSASSFIHAEDDGAPFEDVVLRERGRFRRP